jgi:hypothetical protein
MTITSCFTAEFVGRRTRQLQLRFLLNRRAPRATAERGDEEVRARAVPRARVDAKRPLPSLVA